MRLVKATGHLRPRSGMFAVAGSKETGIAKAFALMLASSQPVFQVFMKRIGFDHRITNRVFLNTTIKTEAKSSVGRTDIELEHPSLFHVIIECKVRSGAITGQASQYDSTFNPKSPDKIFCGVSQRHYYRLWDSSEVKKFFLDWFDVMEELNRNRKTRQLELVRDFIGFIEEEIKVSRRRDEVLIQDVGVEIELERFFKNNIYRRNPAKINPLYFAPYFTHNAMRDEGVGISYISPVMAILTGYPRDIGKAEMELRVFSGDQPDLVEKWLSGIRKVINPGEYEQEFTYFFLGDPEALPRPLKKARTGMSKGWIGPQIPRNMCVTFSVFLQQLLHSDD